MVEISQSEAVFMLSCLELTPRLRRILEDCSDSGLTLSDDDADALRDRCGDRLQTHGFDGNYAPTQDGRTLESLIDKLFIG